MVTKRDPVTGKRIPSFPAETPKPKRIPRRVREGIDIVDPTTGQTRLATPEETQAIREKIPGTTEQLLKESLEQAEVQAIVSARITRPTGRPSQPRFKVRRANGGITVVSEARAEPAVIIPSGVTAPIVSVAFPTQVVREEQIQRVLQPKISPIQPPIQPPTDLERDLQRFAQAPSLLIEEFVEREKTRINTLLESVGISPDVSIRLSIPALATGRIPIKLVSETLPKELKTELTGTSVELGKTTIGGLTDIGSFFIPVFGAVRFGSGVVSSASKFLTGEELTTGEKVELGLGALIVGGSLLRKPITSLVGNVIKRTPKERLPNIRNVDIRPPTRKPRPGALEEPFPRIIKDSPTDKQVTTFVRRLSNERGINFDKLSKVDQNFLKGQVAAKIKAKPELALPEARQLALKRTASQFQQDRLIQTASEARRSVALSERKAFDENLRLLLQRQPELAVPRARQLALQQTRDQFAQTRLIERAAQLRSKSETALQVKLKGEVLQLQKSKPELFIDKPRQQALINFEEAQVKLKKVKETPEGFQLVSEQQGIKVFKEKPKFTGQDVKGVIAKGQKGDLKASQFETPSIQQKALNRFKEGQKEVKKLEGFKLIKQENGIKVFIDKPTQEFVKEQVKARIRNQPETLLPKVQQQALQLVQKPTTLQKDKIIKITQVPKLSKEEERIRKLALERAGFKVPKQKGKLVTKEGKVYKQFEATISDVKKPIQLQQISTFAIKRKPRKLQVLIPMTSAGATAETFEEVQAALSEDIRIPLTQQQTNEGIQVIDLGKAGVDLTLGGLNVNLGNSLERAREKEAVKQSVSQATAQSLITQTQTQLQQSKQQLRQRQRQRFFELTGQKERIDERVREREKLIPKEKLVIIPTPSKKVIKALKKGISKGAFDVFTRKAGKFNKINTKPLPRGRALKLGATRVSDNLRATFKIEKTRKTTKLKDVDFQPSPRVFRDFKIVRGSRIKTPNQFIERRKFRLDSPNEKRAIKQARRQKNFLK